MRNRKYTDEQLIAAIKNNKSVAGVLKELGIKPAGGSHTHIKNRIKNMGLDISHFTGSAGSNRGKKALNRLTHKEILVDGYKRREDIKRIRRALDERGVPVICAKCGIGPEWDGEYLQLEVDHIDSDWTNNKEENLQYLCPNCHAQLTKKRRHGSVVESADTYVLETYA